MRQIKFRGWSNEKVEHSDGPQYMGFWKWVAYDSNTKVMQYTGVTDRHDKEIYEGDILKTPTYDACVVEWNGDKKGYVLREIRASSPFYDADLVTSQDLRPIDFNGFYEVIGSIYEIRDLLKEEIK